MRGARDLDAFGKKKYAHFRPRQFSFCILKQQNFFVISPVTPDDLMIEEALGMKTNCRLLAFTVLLFPSLRMARILLAAIATATVLAFTDT